VTLAASLDALLSDSNRASAVLPALARIWPELLQSIAMGLRQAPASQRSPYSPAGSPGRPLWSPGGGSGSAAAPHRAVAPTELAAMVRVLELACLLAAQARQASLAAGLLPLLLAQLPAAPPELACACLDACLAVQLRCPPAFAAFTELRGIEQVRRMADDGWLDSDESCLGDG
jgi:hypothetical protein